jgi:hypothetical protein
MKSPACGEVSADQTVIDAAGRRTVLADELSTVKSMVTVNTSPIAQAVIGGVLVANGFSLRAANREKTAFYRRNLQALLGALDRHFAASQGGMSTGTLVGQVHQNDVVQELAVDLAAEFERVTPGHVGEIVDPLEPPFVRQRVALQKRGAAEREIAAPVGVGFRRRLVSDLVLKVTAPLEPHFVDLVPAERGCQAEIVRVDPHIVGAVTSHIAQHDRRAQGQRNAVPVEP